MADYSAFHFGRHRRQSISLLPTTYIAVPRMTQAIKEIHEQVATGEDITSCINIMSGPSNSADIEMDIVVGVHGTVKLFTLWWKISRNCPWYRRRTGNAANITLVCSIDVSHLGLTSFLLHTTIQT